MTLRAHRRRRIGVGLLAFGAAGLVLVIAAGVLVINLLSAVGDVQLASTGSARR